MRLANGFLNRLPRAGAAALQPAMLAMLAMAAAIGGCMEERVAGTTTTGNTGKGTISGRVLNAKGEGVANARVRVVSVDHNPGPGGAGEVADVVLTASDGAFRTDSLADGLYNLLDEKAGELAFQDSVAVDGDAEAVADVDVLRPPGSLAGVVRLQPGHDSRTVFLILPGTTTLALPMDSVGNFRLFNLAEGEYRLRILSTLDAYKPLDTVVTIASGVQGILRDTLRLSYKATPGVFPFVDSLRLAYDSIGIAATLTWRKADPAFAASYVVYRKHRDSAYVKMNRGVLAETSFVDDWTTGLRPGNHYEYAVTAVDPWGNEGRKTEGVPLNPGVRYRLDTRVPGNDCSTGLCHYDVDAAGDVHVSDANGIVWRYGPVLGETKWPDPHFGAIDPHSDAFTSRPIVVDTAGSVYMLYKQPLRLGKVDSAGKSVWIKPLPNDWPEIFSLHRAGDSLLIWRAVEGVMAYYDLNGDFLGQETLMRFLQSPDPSRYPEYKPGTGFFIRTDSGIRILDRDGNLLADWVLHPELRPESRPESLGDLVDVARDAEGRWFVSWGMGVVEVYSPDRLLLGPIMTGSRGDFFKYGNGGLYLESNPGYQIVKIVLGY